MGKYLWIFSKGDRYLPGGRRKVEGSLVLLLLLIDCIYGTWFCINYFCTCIGTESMERWWLKISTFGCAISYISPRRKIHPFLVHGKSVSQQRWATRWTEVCFALFILYEGRAIDVFRKVGVFRIKSTSWLSFKRGLQTADICLTSISRTSIPAIHLLFAYVISLTIQTSRYKYEARKS